MIKKFLTLVIVASLSVPSFAAGPASSVSASSANVIESVTVQSSGKFAKVVIQSSRPLKARDIAQADGLAVSLYMTEPTLCKRPVIERVDGEIVQEVRYGYQGAKVPSGSPLPLDYVTIRLKEPVSYQVSQREWVFQMELKARGSSVTTPSSISAAKSGGVAPVTLQRGGRVAALPSNPTLDDFLKTGLFNHVPLRLAQEEFGLARIRRFDAGRGRGAPDQRRAEHERRGRDHRTGGDGDDADSAIPRT